MSFTSTSFLIFFAVVFVLYNLLAKKKAIWQNLLLTAASYFFYAYADWKLLWILVVITLGYFYLGQAIGRARSERAASALTTLGVTVGIGTLIYFKYLNFFISSFVKLFESFGLHTDIHTFKIIIPLGISFFIFKVLSYCIEINRKKVEPSRDLVAFATYVSFFPCIVAGPIDRPGFLAQLNEARKFDYETAVDGCRQFLWGMFKKIVIADNIAGCVNNTWARGLDTIPGGTLLIVAILYSFQMYSDFSGYSDMAIGIGKVLGLKIARNFNYPFFAVNVADYWRRWHMSLTSWLTDYVFMPLNVKFRSLGQFGMILAIIINFVLVGMWHGDNWTYAVFGLYHGLLFIPLILSGAFFKKGKISTGRLGLPTPKDLGRIVLTFLLVTIGLVIFRADSVGSAFEYLWRTVSGGILRFNLAPKHIQCILFIFIMLAVEWAQRKKEHGLELSGIRQQWLKYAIYVSLVFVMVIFSTDSSTFIYAQF